MKKHYNLYYLFLEDKQRNPMPEDRRLAVRRIIEAFYSALWPPTKKLLISEKILKKIKPIENPKPPNIRRTKELPFRKTKNNI